MDKLLEKTSACNGTSPAMKVYCETLQVMKINSFNMKHQNRQFTKFISFNTKISRIAACSFGI